MDFTRSLLVNHYQALSGLEGNWEVHTGDFRGASHAQILLYDPSTGALRFLVFAPDLRLLLQVNDTILPAGMVLYIGHFGLPALSVMLYDPQAGKSTFVAFDTSLHITQQATVPGWDRNWQVLVGAFLDRSACIAAHSCSVGDDILALDRTTGTIQQFVFSFGNPDPMLDRCVLALLHEGEIPAMNPALRIVDPPGYTLGITLDTGITDEELY